MITDDSSQEPAATGGVPPPALLHERLQSLDVMKGLALFGVLLVNVTCSFRVWQFEYILSLHTDEGLLNHLVDYVREFFITGKAIALFTMLFGAGVAMLQERHRAGLLVKRQIILLVMGLAHLLLLWDGDILAQYAVAGLVLLAFARFRTRTLVTTAVVLIFINAVFYRDPGPPDKVAWREFIQSVSTWYAHGTYADIVQLRWSMLKDYTWIEVKWTFCPMMGIMLLGMAAWRSGLLRRPGEWRPLLRRLVVICGPLGVQATVACLWVRATDVHPGAWFPPCYTGGYVLMAIAYGSALLLWMDREKPEGPVVRHLAAMGRMSLTNYLTQTVLFTTLFYGYGFALHGRLSTVQVTVLGIMVYFLQLVASEAWLRTYTHGPMEALWRRLTYGRVQRVPAVPPG